MVFGVFDGLHAGHHALFAQAKNLGNHLIAVVAPDLVVRQLKNRLPRNLLETRLAAVQQAVNVDLAVSGDEEIGAWAVVKKYRPDVIAVGYDQTALAEDLNNHLTDFKWSLEVQIMNAHNPKKLHSSIMNTN